MHLGQKTDAVMRWRWQRVGVAIDDLALAVAQDVTSGWEPDDWRAARRGLRPHQRVRIRDLTEALASEWAWLGDMPVTIRAYARTLQRAVPRYIRAMARAPELREWPLRPF
jgi:hypothetical protein